MLEIVKYSEDEYAFPCLLSIFSGERLSLPTEVSILKIPLCVLLSAHITALVSKDFAISLARERIYVPPPHSISKVKQSLICSVNSIEYILTFLGASSKSTPALAS